MKLYLITADPIWPVGNAGAVIVAKTQAEAESLFYSHPELSRCKSPNIIHIGRTFEYSDPQILFYNSGEY